MTLHEVYKDYFRIGAAVNTKTVLEDKDLISTHFNSITAENEMKFELLHPRENEYTFEAADSIVDFAKQHNIEMRGHTLVWHNQTPRWVFENESGSLVTREVLLNRLQEHIKTVMEHFKDPFYSWDVVNEAVEDHGNFLLRKSPWLEIIGEDFIDKAFYFAKEANPVSNLYYNDYNESHPEKREKIYKLVEGLVARGVPIDGIGLQGHWNLNNPSIEDIRKAIERYASLGLKLEITEMDISVFDFEDTRTDLVQPTNQMLEIQAEKYENVFKLFREYSEHIESVTFWGVSDRYTWLSDFPVKDRKNWPLVFDKDGKPKKSFESITDFFD
ncbi:endo-1,4-beta-xylanase [Jeotgalibaca ciconiae]|uniref:Beta-xylanase n=2 Tax=Jeotgalibaca ciconiae TaxID=2496265 RepID=A0A3Q9BM55_9LACT|nr:endo-1,4-beta-xylanase [Jeotgalibaca ciconiae]